MRDFLRSLFGRKPAAPAAPDPQAEFARLNALAPLQRPGERPAAAGEGPAATFVCREAVLNRGERIAGYEFSLHRRLHARLRDARVLIRKVYDDALLRGLASLQVDALLGHRLAFIDLAPASLDNPLLAQLPAGNCVLLLDPPADAPLDAEALGATMARLRGRGFRLGWRVRAGGPLVPALLARCQFVQVLTPGFDGLQIAALLAQLRELPADDAGRELIASDLATHDDFGLCFRAGFDYFQGPFITSREQWTPPKGEVDRTHVIQLLNQARAGAETADLVAGLRQDPVLTYKLLRYINSPAIGLQKAITTLDQGLVVLGREKFYRWLSLLLFDMKRSGYAERGLIEQALVRARLMERLGQGIAGVNADHLFLTGMFSLLDELLDQPIEQVLAKVAVPDAVRLALLTRQGPLAPFLSLAVASESGDADDIREQAAHCGVSAAAINRELLGALVWANEIGELTE